MPQKHATHGLPLILTLLALQVLALILAPAPAAEAQAAQPQAQVTADVLNIRSGPGTAYGSIGRATTGQTYPITGKNADGKWLVIDLGGKQGWVLGQYVKASGALDGLAVVKAPAAPKAAAKPAAAPRPTPPGFFDYGIQFDPGNLGESVSGTANLGIRWAKWQVQWKDFEGGGPGQRNWPEDVVDAFKGTGIQLLASIVKAPQWARGGNPDMSVEGPPADPSTYASFVGEFAGRYCGRVQAIEVWNEQNLHYEWGNERLDAARYVQLLAAAYRAIKAACPSMIVVSGAPTPTGATPPAAIRDTTYLEQMYRAGLRNYSDAIGVHPVASAIRRMSVFRIGRPANTGRPRTYLIHRSTSATPWNSTGTSW